MLVTSISLWSQDIQYALPENDRGCKGKRKRKNGRGRGRGKKHIATSMMFIVAVCSDDEKCASFTKNQAPCSHPPKAIWKVCEIPSRLAMVRSLMCRTHRTSEEHVCCLHLTPFNQASLIYNLASWLSHVLCKGGRHTWLTRAPWATRPQRCISSHLTGPTHLKIGMPDKSCSFDQQAVHAKLYMTQKQKPASMHAESGAEILHRCKHACMHARKRKTPPLNSLQAPT